MSSPFGIHQARRNLAEVIPQETPVLNEPVPQEPVKTDTILDPDTLKTVDSDPITSSEPPEKEVVKKIEIIIDSIRIDSIVTHSSIRNSINTEAVPTPIEVQEDPIQLPISEETQPPLQDTLDTKFTITEQTSSSELARIARLASEAGIEYTYVVDMRRKLIHELNIVMVIRATGERSQLWVAYPKKTSSFSEEIGWNTNEEGKAVSLSKSKIEHLVKAKHPLN